MVASERPGAGVRLDNGDLYNREMTKRYTCVFNRDNQVTQAIPEISVPHLFAVAIGRPEEQGEEEK